MAQDGTSPGPIADRTYEAGFKSAAAAGVAVVGLAYWLGWLSSASTVHLILTVALFPVYLIFVAALLGVWLGYATDERDLQRVTPDESSDSRDVWDRWR